METKLETHLQSEEERKAQAEAAAKAVFASENLKNAIIQMVAQTFFKSDDSQIELLELENQGAQAFLDLIPANQVLAEAAKELQQQPDFPMIFGYALIASIARRAFLPS